MKSKFLITLSAAAIMLAASPLALAHEVSDSTHVDMGLHLGQILKMDPEFKAEIKEMRAEVKAAKENEKSNKKENKSDNKFGPNATIGVVTSINGSVFTIDPFGKKSTTTVSTNGSTVFTLNGKATTTSALTVGERVIVIGTTTATSTTGNSFSASLVNIFVNGWSHFKHVLHVKI